MEGASQVRRAAREAVGETGPERLRARIFEALDAGSMVPGVLVGLSARVGAGNGTEGRDETRRPVLERSGADRNDLLGRRAAGVQLIYEGLALTRTLANEEPWDDPSRNRTDADIAILAADVLVARGFHLLARTGCAPRAVETVRRFGRDQTRRRDPEASAEGAVDTDTGSDAEADAVGDRNRDRGLEADALALAVCCGAGAVGSDVPADLDAFTADLAESTDDESGFPAAETFLSSSVADSLATFLDERAPGASEGLPPATDGG